MDDAIRNIHVDNEKWAATPCFALLVSIYRLFNHLYYGNTIKAGGGG